MSAIEQLISELVAVEAALDNARDRLSRAIALAPAAARASASTPEPEYESLADEREHMASLGDPDLIASRDAARAARASTPDREPLRADADISESEAGQ